MFHAFWEFTRWCGPYFGDDHICYRPCGTDALDCALLVMYVKVSQCRLSSCLNRRCGCSPNGYWKKRGFMNIDPSPALFRSSPEEGRCLESGRIHRHGCNRQRSAVTPTSPRWPNRTGMYFRALRVGHRSKQCRIDRNHTRLVQTPKSQCLYRLWWRRYGPSSIRPFHKHGTTDLETQ